MSSKKEEVKKKGTIGKRDLIKDMIRTYEGNLVWLEREQVNQRHSLSHYENMLANTDIDNNTRTELLQIRDGIKETLHKLEEEIIEVRRLIVGFKL